MFLEKYQQTQCLSRSDSKATVLANSALPVLQKKCSEQMQTAYRLASFPKKTVYAL